MSNETPSANAIPAAATTRRLDDIEFITICERIAKGDSPSIEAMAKETGMSEKAVRERRVKIRNDYKDHGFEWTALPRGGKKKSNSEAVATVAAKLKELGFISTKLDETADESGDETEPNNETDSEVGDETNAVDAGDEDYEDVDETELESVN